VWFWDCGWGENIGVVGEAVPEGCALPRLSHFSCLMDFGPLNGGRFGLRADRQVSLAVGLFSRV